MSVFGSLKVLVDAAKVVTGVKDAAAVATSATGALTNAHKRLTTTSLTQLTKQTTIRSRVYIDDTISSDPIVAQILRTGQTMYTGMILNALQLQNLVTAGHTVRDSLSVVQTKGALETFQDVMPAFDRVHASLEALGVKFTTRPSLESQTTMTGDESDKAAHAQRVQDALDGVKPTPTEQSKLGGKDITPAPADLFPVGKLIEVTLSNPEHPEVSQTVTLLVQMMPYLVPQSVMSLMLTIGTKPSVRQRFSQFKAGEISFWRDLVFQVDQISKLQKAARDDKSGSFSDYLKDVTKKDVSRIGAIFTAVTGHDKTIPSSNISNAVLVISEDTAIQAKADSGVNFEDPQSRALFFKNTYSMMVFVVDQSYHQVTLYMNGISDVGVYSFDQFSTKKGFDALDIVGLLSTMSQNRAPRF